jgi:hypothetical protein
VGAVQSALGVGGCGRVIVFFGFVLIAVRQGRQRRDAVAAGDEQLGRCAAGQPHLSRQFTFEESELLADSFAVGMPTPANASAVLYFTPPAPAAQDLGVGLRRPLGGQTEQLLAPHTSGPRDVPRVGL